MDVQMPEMDGLAATIAIREKEKLTGHHLPVIAMTALVMKGGRERCMEAGMDGYVCKPIDVKALDEILDGCEERRHKDFAVVAPNNDPSLAPVDAAELLERIDGDRAFLSELVTIFRGEYPGQIQNAQEAIARKDAAGVERVGHTLKGALGSLSATGASTFAGQLETMGKSGDLTLAGAKLTEVENEVHRAMETLDALSLESV
jgi:two-component system sensor histidine kinase/response regulator